LPRMFADILASVSTRWPHNWKMTASPSGHLLFHLAPSMPRTAGTDSGLWRTPLATDGDKSGQGNLPHQVKMWPTANARDWKDTPGMVRTRPDGRSRTDQLARAVYAEMWPTPQAGATNPEAHNAMSGDFKKRFCERAGIPMTGTLNPQFVEWLMGYPIGYTALEPSATQLFLRSQNSSDEQSSHTSSISD
jgi:hypothetical protein